MKKILTENEKVAICAHKMAKNSNWKIKTFMKLPFFQYRKLIRSSVKEVFSNDRLHLEAFVYRHCYDYSITSDIVNILRSHCIAGYENMLSLIIFNDFDTVRTAIWEWCGSNSEASYILGFCLWELWQEVSSDA